jgi:hypothetical protein
VIYEGFEVSLGLETGLDCANEPLQAAKSVELLFVAHFCSVERGTKEVQRFVVRL